MCDVAVKRQTPSAGSIPLVMSDDVFVRSWQSAAERDEEENRTKRIAELCAMSGGSASLSAGELRNIRDWQLLKEEHIAAAGGE